MSQFCVYTSVVDQHCVPIVLHRLVLQKYCQQQCQDVLRTTGINGQISDHVQIQHWFSV